MRAMVVLLLPATLAHLTPGMANPVYRVHRSVGTDGIDAMAVTRRRLVRYRWRTGVAAGVLERQG